METEDTNRAMELRICPWSASSSELKLALVMYYFHVQVIYFL